jgi:hypothetical protein
VFSRSRLFFTGLRAIGHGATMAISGNIETMGIAELLQWLANGRQTGTLVVESGTVEKRVFLRDGKILSSSSSDPRRFLGHFLVSKGVISEDDLAMAMDLQAERHKLLGEILVDSGVIAKEMLDRMLSLNAEENLYDLVAWEEGHFEFIDDELPEYELVPISKDITGLLMEGMRRIDMTNRLAEVIPSIQCVPVSVGPLLDDDEMDLGWQGVLEAVDDDRSIEDICLHTHSSEYFVCNVLFQKVQEGKIKIVRPRTVGPETGFAVVDDEQETAATDVGETTPANAQSLISEAVAHLELGAYETAARHLGAATSLDPHNRELAMVIREIEKDLRKGLERSGVNGTKVPVLEASLDDVRTMSLSPEEGFVLSRINGSSDIAAIVKISPLSELDSLLVFWKLALSKLISLKSPS